MSLNPTNLDDLTRKMMVVEIEDDITSQRTYLSSRLNQRGTEQWTTLLKEAVEHHDDAWLANEIRSKGLLKEVEERRKPKGGYTNAKLPFNAHEMLAEGEFNRVYIRGLARRAIEEGKSLIVYRAKEVVNPRQESEDKIGNAVDPKQLLEDLRTHIGMDTALGLPAGPNSGLSVQFGNN